MSKGPNRFWPSGKLKALELREGSGIGVSNLGSARIRYQELTNTTELSENGGPYIPISASTSSIYFNVMSYGAVGNGIVDDTAAIQATVAAAAAAGGGVVWFPAGTYKVTSTIVLSSGVTLLGPSGDVSVIASSIATTDPVIKGDTVTDVSIEDLSITHVPALAGSVVIRLLNSTDVNVGSVTLSGTYAIGVHLSNCIGAIIEKCDISGAVTGGGYQGGILFTGAPAKAIVDSRTEIRYNYLHDNTVFYDIDTDYFTNNCGLSIHHNRCASTGVELNIGLFNGVESSVCNNECSGAVTDGTHTAGGYGIGCYIVVGIGNVARDLTVNDNHVHNVEGSGIYLHGQVGVTAVGNLVHHCCSVELPTSLQVAAIACDTGPATISANTIHDSGQAGISIACNDVTVSCNAISTTGTGNISLGLGCGIILRGSVMHNVSVTGNSLKNTGGGIGCLATGNVYNLSVLGNEVDGTLGLLSGIQVHGVAGGCIGENTVVASGGDGVLVLNSTGVSVTENIVHDGSVGNTGVYRGVVLVDTIDCEVAHNHIFNTVPNLLDANMETVGTANWPASIGTETITKSLITPHSGLQCLRIVTPTAYGGAYQVALVPGVTYNLQGWGRGDGAGFSLPAVSMAGGTILWTGTNSNAWQPINVTFQANHPYLSLHNVVVAGYVEFDDFTLTNAAVFGQGIVDTAGCLIIRVIDNIILNISTEYSLSSTSPEARGNRFTSGPRFGRVTLVGGTKIVATTEVRTTDSIVLSRMTPGGSMGQLSVANVATVPGQFDINSSDAGDLSNVYWEIVH